MKNVQTSDNQFSATIADTLSDSTIQDLKEVADHGKSRLDRSFQAARNLQHSRLVKHVKNNPIKTAGLIGLGSLVLYTLCRRNAK